MTQKIKLWMIGTKRTEFNEDLCIGIKSGIVILAIKKINKVFKICVYQAFHFLI